MGRMQKFLLEDALVALRKGRRSEAESMLGAIVALNPRNEEAWLWLSTCVHTLAERQTCLERCLTINPQNHEAAEMLNAIVAGISTSSWREPGASKEPSVEPKLFLSYRRDDSMDICGRIYDGLVLKFGRDRLLRDVDSIPFGIDFKQHIVKLIAESGLLLAVVGRMWLGESAWGGKTRIDDPSDFVRLEVENALKVGIPVLPVLVQGSSMPRADQLPKSLGDFVNRNAISIRPDPDFHNDLERLISACENLLKADSTR